MTSMFLFGTRASRADGSVRVTPYEFRRQSRVSLDRLRRARAIFDRLAGPFTSVFTQRLRMQANVVVADVAQMTFADYVAQLSKPCSAFVYDLGDQERNQFLFEFGREIPFFVIDRLFGGAGSVLEENRPLSDTERTALRDNVVDRMAQLFAEHWHNYLEFHPEFRMVESSPEMLDIVSRDDAVLVVSFQFEAGSLNVPFTICLPIAALGPFLSATSRENLAVSSRTAMVVDEADRERIELAIRDAVVNVICRLPIFRLHVRDLMALQPGHIVHTGILHDSSIEVVPGDRAHFLGRLGHVGMLLGIHVEKPFVTVDELLSNPPKARLLMMNENQEMVPVPTDTEEAKSEILETLQARDLSEVIPEGSAKLERFMDLTLPVTVEVGRIRMSVNELLQLGHGSVIQLDRFADEPCDIRVGEVKFAEGQLVMVGEHYGVRVTSVVDRKSRSTLLQSES